MIWANLLHFYQPQGQKRHIIDAIAAQCYRPVAEGILAHPDARLTINFTGGLLEQLEAYGYGEILEMYAEAARRGQVEFVSSSKYHAILPLLPAAEALRQIEAQNETGRRLLGDAYKPRGIFLPEMAWSPKLAPVLEKAGMEWVMLDELAYNGHVGQVDYSQTYEVESSGLKALFREHRLSATIMSAAPRDVAALKNAARDELAEERYVLTGMDGETFGHHRVGHEQLLFGMFEDPEIQMVTMSEVFDKFPRTQTVKTVACTWASSEDDIAKGIPYISWSDPDNEVHKLQWHLLELTAREMRKLPQDNADWGKLRERMDQAEASDQFFWAAAKPWWMIEHIERGAHDLESLVQDLPTAKTAVREQARGLYNRILSLAYDWQREGKIDNLHHHRAQRVRIPFMEFTKEGGDPALWKAVMELIHDAQSEAAGREDYEEAILWRNAAYTLEHKLDIYEAIYVMDLVKKQLPAGRVADVIAKYKRQFDHIRGGQVEQRTN